MQDGSMCWLRDICALQLVRAWSRVQDSDQEAECTEERVGWKREGKQLGAGGEQVGSRWGAGGEQVGSRWGAGGEQVGSRWGAGGEQSGEQVGSRSGSKAGEQPKREAKARSRSEKPKREAEARSQSEKPKREAKARAEDETKCRIKVKEWLRRCAVCLAWLACSKTRVKASRGA